MPLQHVMIKGKGWQKSIGKAKAEWKAKTDNTD
jgi:hypothetical protein